MQNSGQLHQPITGHRQFGELGLKIIAYHSNKNTDSTIVPIEIKYSPEITPDLQSMAFQQTDLEGVLDEIPRWKRSNILYRKHKKNSFNCSWINLNDFTFGLTILLFVKKSRNQILRKTGRNYVVKNMKRKSDFAKSVMIHNLWPKCIFWDMHVEHAT